MLATAYFDGQALIVEDEFFIRTAVSDTLRDVGCIVHEAFDYAEAVGLLAAHDDIEAVITDISMPGPRDGNDLIRAIRVERPNLIVIAATATRIQGLVDGVLRKPYDPSDAAEMVRRLVIGHRLESLRNQHLEQAERHVAEGEKHVLRQLALLEQLAADGHDTADARATLTQFEELLMLHIADRDRLRREVAKGK